jgi:predicted Rossmann fold nucleotide-binding protein DprA/Smf involved in DNA uptake
VKTIIAGSRNIVEYQALLDAIVASGFEITEVVSGGARGVDSLGERYAKEKGISLKIFPADWESHGRKAGIMRNTEMAHYADALIAVWDGLSPGTLNMINQAQSRGLKVYTLRVRVSQDLKENSEAPWNKD